MEKKKEINLSSKVTKLWPNDTVIVCLNAQLLNEKGNKKANSPEDICM